MLLDQAKIGWLTYNYMYFPIQRAPHVHNNTTIQKDAHQKLIMICCVRICLNKRKSFLLPEFFKIFFVRRSKGFGGVQCLWCPESIVSRIDGGQGRKVPPSFFCAAAFILFFHFSLSLSTFNGNTNIKFFYTPSTKLSPNWLV